MVGRKTRLGTIGAFRDFVGRKHTWMGTWVALVCILIMFYYSVVTGWCMKYLTLALTGTFKPGLSTADTQAIWDGFIGSPAQTLAFHALAIGIAGFIILKGVNAGIEKACKVMIPALFLLLIVAAVRAITLPGAAAGLEFLFNPRFEMLASPTVWIEAFTQASWSTGAGWGLVLTYAVYTRHREDVAGNAMIMGVGDNIGALLAGLVVLPAIFALSPSLEVANQTALTGGTGLTFVFLAQLFGTMPGGNLIAAMFFMAMTLAALSSLLPMVEVGVRNLMDMGLERKAASRLMIVLGFVGGIPSAVSMTFFANQDNVTGFGLWVSGLFFVYAVLKYGVEKVRTAHVNMPWTDFIVGRWFDICIYLAPVVTVVLFWQYLPDLLKADNRWQVWGTDWSFGTIAFQFMVYLSVGLLTMGALNRRIGQGTLPEDYEEETP